MADSSEQNMFVVAEMDNLIQKQKRIISRLIVFILLQSILITYMLMTTMNTYGYQVTGG